MSLIAASVSLRRALAAWPGETVGVRMTKNRVSKVERRSTILMTEDFLASEARGFVPGRSTPNDDDAFL
jgi:hypothetical protein